MRQRSLFVRFIVAAIAALALAACATTEFRSSWRNPEAQPLRLRGKKVVAVFVTHDSYLRERAEDAMVREIQARGADGVASYTFLSDREIRDRDAARAEAERRGCAGAVVMRIVGSDMFVTRMPSGVIWVGAPYDHFWGGYWGWGWGTVWSPGYLQFEHVVKVETLVYSLENDQLVWAGVSRTIDPGRIESFIGELAAAISDRMERDGVFGPNRA